MFIEKIYNVIGIMSGTSMDGIDCSYIKTDGKNSVSIINEKTYQYSQNYRNKLKRFIKKINIEKKYNNHFFLKKNDIFITNKFILTIRKFIKEKKIKKSSIDYISVSGQTIYHNPNKKISIQLGSGKRINKKLKIKVISNFRDKDINHGGQGAPIGAFYHKFLIKNFFEQSAIVNLGGIANITYYNKDILIAFDLGPANLLTDDLMYYFYKKNYDKDGKIAFEGNLNKDIFKKFKNDIFFKKKYPKSLDREYFKNYYNELIKYKNKDAIFTASMMTIESIMLGYKLLNKKIKNIILTGGGRKNLFILKKITNFFKKKNIGVKIIDKYNFNGDFLESQAFAYIGIRSIKNYPLSTPKTTGVKKSITGGILYNQN